MVAHRIIIVAAALLLAGCWPARFVYQPGVKGAVVSSADGTPVVNASIRLTVPREDIVPKASRITGRDGLFDVQPYSQWHIASIFGETWPGQGSVEISAPGYLPYRQNLEWAPTGPRTHDLGVIRLSRSQ
jgi:hypothetical protein